MTGSDVPLVFNSIVFNSIVFNRPKTYFHFWKWVVRYWTYFHEIKVCVYTRAGNQFVSVSELETIFLNIACLCIKAGKHFLEYCLSLNQSWKPLPLILFVFSVLQVVTCISPSSTISLSVWHCMPCFCSTMPLGRCSVRTTLCGNFWQ